MGHKRRRRGRSATYTHEVRGYVKLGAISVIVIEARCEYRSQSAGHQSVATKSSINLNFAWVTYDHYRWYSHPTSLIRRRNATYRRSQHFTISPPAGYRTFSGQQGLSHLLLGELHLLLGHGSERVVRISGHGALLQSRDRG